MRIHSDVLTSDDIYAATNAAGMRGVHAEVTQAGSRSRRRRFDVNLTGTSNRRTNPGTGDRYSDDYAATWDEWGMFIQALYGIDPQAIIGQYQSALHFEEVTYDRYISLTAPYQHKNHKWVRNAGDGVSDCKFCDARYDFHHLHRVSREARDARKATI